MYRMIKHTCISLLTLPFLTAVNASSLYNAPDISLRLKDQDKDGVINARDLCPDTAPNSVIDNNGCPEHDVHYLSGELDVHFGTGEHELKPSFYSGLLRLGKFLQKNPNTIAIITGHTDDVGDAAANKLLSQKRAQSIAKVLSEKFKIDIERIVALGYGESRPVLPNDSEADRKRNRRVQATVVSQFQAKETVAQQKWTVWDYKVPGGVYSTRR